jgi:hypothetical protein
MLRQQSLRQKAIGHDEHMCELLLRHEEIEDEEEEEVEIEMHSSSDDNHDDDHEHDHDHEEPHSFVPKLRNHKVCIQSDPLVISSHDMIHVESYTHGEHADDLYHLHHTYTRGD